MRSIGESTHRAANATASLARRGTRGSARSRRAVVTQSGRNPARSLSSPGGSRRASTTSRTQLATSTMAAIASTVSQSRMSMSVHCGR
jgi:hypothetical protein